MDSPVVAQLFRQLFRHRPRGCQGLRPPPPPSSSTLVAHAYSARRAGIGRAAAPAGAPPHHSLSRRPPSYRSYATRASRDRGMKSNESRWQQRTHIMPEDRREEFAQYPYMSIQDLKRRTERPRKVKMLLRDFIDGSFLSPIHPLPIKA